MIKERYPTLAWVDELSCDNPIFDRLTYTFLKHTNNFIASIGKVECINILERSLGFLADYAKEHFDLQNDWMDKTNYPGLHAHQAEHLQFIKKLALLYKLLISSKKNIHLDDPEYDPRGTDGIIIDAYDFLLQWYYEHLLGADRRFFEYLEFEFENRDDEYL